MKAYTVYESCCIYNFVCYLFDPKVIGKPRNEAGSQSQAERLLGFEPGFFRFWKLHLNPLGHSPKIKVVQFASIHLILEV